MTTRYGSVFAASKSGTNPQAQPDGRYVGSKRRCTTEIVTLAAQASGDVIFIGTLPINAVFEGVTLTTDTALGSSTLAAGTLASAAKYGAAATLTATDTPTDKTKTAAKAQVPLTAPEDVYLTIGAAALPGAGILVTELRYRTMA